MYGTLSHHAIPSVRRTRKGISLKNLSGEKILIHRHIGFWYDICRQKIPGATFLEQDELSAHWEIVQASTLPSFVTDVSGRRNGPLPKGKVAVPLFDKEVDVDFWCVCRKTDAERYASLFAAIAGLSE